MVIRILASALMGVMLYLMLGWLVDKVSSAAAPESPLKASLEWFLSLMSPMLFGSLFVVFFAVLAYFALGRFFAKPA
jgi:hypothetical protein